MKYCDDCEFLKPKEKDQVDKSNNHYCTVLQIMIFHYWLHPRLPRPLGCQHYKQEK